MKRALFIIGFVLIAIGLNAQDKFISGYGLAGFTNSAASRKTAAYNYTFMINVDAPYMYSLSIRQDDLGGVPANNTSTAYLQGSNDNVNYRNVDTCSYDGSGTYTVLYRTSFKKYAGYAYFNEPLAWKYLRVNVTPSDTIWIKSIWLNVLPLK